MSQKLSNGPLSSFTARSTVIGGEHVQHVQLVDESGNYVDASAGGGGSGSQYTEGDTDASISGTAILWEDTSDTLRPVSAAKPLPVEIVSGSSSGTEYTEGDVDASITGVAVLMEVAANTLQPVQGTVADGLLVNLGTNNDITGTVTANAGTNLNTSALALESGGNLATIAGKDFATQTTLAALNTKVTTCDTGAVTISALPNEGQQTMANSISVAIASNQSAVPVSMTSTTITGTVAVTQSGTWDEVGINDSGNSITVDDGGTSLTVDGSVSISGTVAVTQSGTWDEVGINDSGNSITVDAPVGTPVFVRLSDGAAAITTLPVSLASVPSHAVTNAGTFAVQAAQSGTWNITNVSGTVSLPTGASTESTLSTLNGKVTACNTGAVTISAALPAGTNAIGKLAANSGVDIGDVDVTSLPKSATGTQTSVNDTNSSTTILASNASRLGASIMNDSSAVLYLRLSSSAASSTTYTVRMVQYGYYEVPFGYTGAITGIWASDPNDGGARVTEFTA